MVWEKHYLLSVGPVTYGCPVQGGMKGRRVAAASDGHLAPLSSLDLAGCPHGRLPGKLQSREGGVQGGAWSWERH